MFICLLQSAVSPLKVAAMPFQVLEFLVLPLTYGNYSKKKKKVFVELIKCGNSR